MAFTNSMEDQMLREYEAKCEILTRLMDKILATDSLAFAKETAFEARGVLYHGI